MTICPRCSGTGQCQACYPAGSGMAANGEVCPVCWGSRKCDYCNGIGSY